ncbi:MAG TPA: hypothetical protein PLN53_01085 [Terricaulis sp.]|nr:hypothetical protein [Terricaulis sp.]
MVDWDSKERGIRIGDSQGVRGIVIGCKSCQRWACIEMQEALRAFGNLYARDLARRLKCSKCGERKGYVMVWAHT